MAVGRKIQRGGPRVGDSCPIHFYAALLSIVLACASRNVRPRPPIHPFFRSPFLTLHPPCIILSIPLKREPNWIHKPHKIIGYKTPQPMTRNSKTTASCYISTRMQDVTLQKSSNVSSEEGKRGTNNSFCPWDPQRKKESLAISCTAYKLVRFAEMTPITTRRCSPLRPVSIYRT